MASLQCYSNAQYPNWNDNPHNPNRNTSHPIPPPTNCTAISEKFRVLMEHPKYAISAWSKSGLHELMCYRGFEFCRVRYTETGPHFGCSCKSEIETRRFKMGNNSCKDLSISESNDYHRNARLVNDKVRRILGSNSYDLPKHEQPPLIHTGGDYRIDRICTCTGNLCNDVSKFRNSTIPESTTLGMNSFTTMDNDDSNTMTEKTQMEIFTTAKLGDTSNTEMLKTIGQETRSSSIEVINKALGSNNAWLYMFSIFFTLLLTIVK